MASLIRSGGGVSKYVYQGFWLAVLSTVVIGRSINTCRFPRISLITKQRVFFLLDFCRDSVDHPKKHETSARCRATRSMKQSNNAKLSSFIKCSYHPKSYPHMNFFHIQELRTLSVKLGQWCITTANDSSMNAWAINWINSTFQSTTH